ncbi:MAG: hypothetical protein PWQ17_1666, partial [Anaerophaga sp.]|nr:hypothetical protein [Anaerophaga sp.]
IVAASDGVVFSSFTTMLGFEIFDENNEFFVKKV